MLNLNNYRMTDASGVGVYVGTYKKYNEGSLFGMWIDLETCSDADEFFEVCRELHKDETDPELMFQDYQGFPEELYHESMTEEDIAKILDYVALSDDDKEMLEDFLDAYGSGFDDIEDIEDVRERCCGKWDSMHEYTDHLADEKLDTYEMQCKHEYDCKGAAFMIKKLREYFDYDSYFESNRYGYSRGSCHGYIFWDK